MTFSSRHLFWHISPLASSLRAAGKSVRAAIGQQWPRWIAPRPPTYISYRISERKHVIQALHASEDRYQRLVEHSYDLVSETDASWKFIYLSPNHLTVLGYETTDLLGHATLEFIHPDDANHTIVGGRTIYEHGVGTMTVRFRHKDGAWLWFETTVRRYETARGEIRYVIISRDITSRRQTELARERLLQILDSSVNEIYVVDSTSLGFEYVNQSACKNLGYEANVVRQMALSEVVVGFKAEKFWEDAKPLLERQVERLRFESVHRRSDGTEYPVDVQMQLVEQADFRVFLAVVLDITERKRAEAQQKKLEEQLQLSQKLETIGSLAGGVAHDFNNILAVILNCTDFALEGLAPDDARRHDLEAVKQAAERGANLTRQLLTFSRKQVVKTAAVDVNQVTTTLQAMLARILGEDIHITLSLEPTLGTIRADPGQLEQVIMNLVVNARDAMRQGGQLTIETSNVELDEEFVEGRLDLRPGAYVLLVVSDTGSGMNAQTKARIFEPFFTTKEPGRGTGLGLATVYGIVRQCGGGIWVYSEKGQGTTFKLYFPREFGPPSPSLPSTHSPTVPPIAQRSDETILVVEDEPAIRGVVERHLRGAGYRVLCAGGGAEALRLVEQSQLPISLLVTDVVMPEMSGRAIAESLVQRHPKLRVLYMSGYTEETLMAHGVPTDGIHVLSKPFTATGLLATIREVLDG